MYLLPVLSYLEPSPPQRPLCVVGRLGRQKKTARRGTMEKKAFALFPSSPRALSIFRLLLFLLRYTVPIGSLCGGERALGEQCIYLNYMFEQRGILSAHVLYREAFISSR